MRQSGTSDFHKYYEMNVVKYLFRWVDRAKLHTIESTFSRLPNASRILDLGAGTGSLSFKLNGKFKVYAADINPNLLKMCKNKDMKSCLIDIEKGLPYKKNTFDGIIMADTIEHLRTPYLLINEIKRVMKDDGILLIFTPPYDSISWVAAEKIHHILTGMVSDHKSPFTQESLTCLLKTHFKRYKVWKINFGLTLCGYVGEDYSIKT